MITLFFVVCVLLLCFVVVRAVVPVAILTAGFLLLVYLFQNHLTHF
jgi:hypothetical protein